MAIPPLTLICKLLWLLFSQICYATDTITQDQQLSDDGSTLVSNGGTFELGFFNPGSSNNRYVGIWYKKISIKTVVWVANRDNPIVRHNSSKLVIRQEGNLVLLSNNNQSLLWTTNVTKKASSSSPIVQLLDTGNLVIKDGINEESVFLWQSFDHPCDTLLSGMKLGWDLRTGLNRRLTSWKSWDDPSSGDIVWEVVIGNNPELVMWKSKVDYFRTGPYTGNMFSGVYAPRNNPLYNWKFVSNKDEVYFQYTLSNSFVVSIIVLNQTLNLRQRLTWIPDTKTWTVYQSLPLDSCDVYNTCGPNGNCIIAGSPICQCLDGFKPKSPQQWNAMDWRQGCVRSEEWSCGVKNKDGFQRLASMKLPNTTFSWVNESITLEECRAKCLENCSCTAYSNLDTRGGGSGCSIWVGELVDMRDVKSGQDLYVRIATSDPDGKHERQKKVILVVAITVSLVLVMLLAFCVYMIKKKYKGKTEIRMSIEQKDQGGQEDLELPFFDLATIITATNNFSINNKLGEGGFGPVYKGLLVDEQEIAIKRLSRSSGQGLKEFRNEVILCAKLQHRNLVKAWRLWKEGTPEQLIDACLANSCSIYEVARCVQISLLCLQHHPDDRPNMTSVVVMLSSENVIPEPKELGFLIRRVSNEREQSSNRQSSSINERNSPYLMEDQPPLRMQLSCIFIDPNSPSTTTSTTNIDIPTLLSLFSQICYVTTDTITKGQPLPDDGNTLLSKDGTFELGFFNPGSSNNRYVGIWYKNIVVKTVVWIANRDNPIRNNSSKLVISQDGNLVLLSQNESLIWTTNASSSEVSSSSPIVQLLDTGNLVIKDGNDKESVFLWQSFDYPCDTLLPGMKFGWDLRTGLNRRLTSWKSWDDPSSGDFTWGVEIGSNPDIVMWKGNVEYFRTGPYTGNMFSGVYGPRNNPLYDYKFVNNKDEVYYQYTLKNSSVITMIVMNQTLYLRHRLTWIPEAKSWTVYQSLPRDSCDVYNTCGPNGNCIIAGSPICQCLDGFEPKSPQQWNVMDWRQGCVRSEEWSCGVKNKDGFRRFASMKLPNTTFSWVNESMTLEECRAKCLENCSCKAYSNLDTRGGGNGCSIWVGDLVDLRVIESGQDLYVRMATSDMDGKHEHRRKVVLVVSTIASLVLVMLVAFCIYMIKKIYKGKTKTRMSREDKDEGRQEDLELPFFDLATIVNATNNFSIENKLGEGGFGPVYKGTLVNGQEIAIKRLSRSSGQGLKEFRNEVILCAKLQHRNLVKAWRLWKEGTPERLTDAHLANSCNISEVIRCIQISLLCLQHHPDDRPNMTSVVVMLTSENALHEPKEPGFLIRRVSNEGEQSSNRQTSSFNEVSISLLNAR
ncbi:G-type lectin S-receptor-like serine/threonine-protein kinase [Glycine max]|nr:G-type lectin S-receptor-like serine/threonine-protein kinase [Glycine max]